MADVHGLELASGSPLGAALDNLRAIYAEQTRGELAKFAGALLLIPVVTHPGATSQSNRVGDLLRAAEQIEGSRFLPTTTQIVISGFERIGFSGMRRKKEVQAAVTREQTVLLAADRAQQYVSLHAGVSPLKRRYPYMGNLVPYLPEKEAEASGVQFPNMNPHFCHAFYVQDDCVPMFGVGQDLAGSAAVMFRDIQVVNNRLVPHWSALGTTS